MSHFYTLQAHGGAPARSLVSLSKSERFVAFQVNHSWNNPGAARRQSARAAWGLRLGLGQARGLIQIQHNTRAHTLMATARRFKARFDGAVQSNRDTAPTARVTAAAARHAVH